METLNGVISEHGMLNLRVIQISKQQDEGDKGGHQLHHTNQPVYSYKLVFCWLS